MDKLWCVNTLPRPLQPSVLKHTSGKSRDSGSCRTTTMSLCSKAHHPAVSILSALNIGHGHDSHMSFMGEPPWDVC